MPHLGGDQGACEVSITLLEESDLLAFPICDPRNARRVAIFFGRRNAVPCQVD